jgi:hypothetical protein
LLGQLFKVFEELAQPQRDIGADCALSANNFVNSWAVYGLRQSVSVIPKGFMNSVRRISPGWVAIVRGLFAAIVFLLSGNP